MLDMGRSTLGVFFFLESEGCLVVLAVFKTVVGSAYRDRGRFDSYPLRFSVQLAMGTPDRTKVSMKLRRNPGIRSR
jgi:hypothetical protein